MDNLVNYMDNDYSVLLGAVKCLPMPSSDRDAVTQTIHQQCSKIKVSSFQILLFKKSINAHFYLTVIEFSLHCADW